jgi:predicted GNAT family acetyltransferase
MSGVSLEFLDGAAEFLAQAGAWLARRPVEATVVATVAQREMSDGVAPGVPHWWAVARDAESQVVGAAMRTAPFEPYPAYVLSMPEQAAVELARQVRARGEVLRAVNGTMPAARLVAEETARLTGRRAWVLEHTRLWEADAVEAPAVEGHLRRAREDEVALARAWYLDFGAAAAEQAGRADPHPTEVLDDEQMLDRIRSGNVWFWDHDGEAVCVVGVSPPAYGVVRIGPVLTPKPHRGHGYASAGVARATQDALDAGHRVCLFTDVDNPVSNRIYAAVGFRPLADTANYLC